MNGKTIIICIFNFCLLLLKAHAVPQPQDHPPVPSSPLQTSQQIRMSAARLAELSHRGPGSQWQSCFQHFTAATQTLTTGK